MRVIHISDTHTKHKLIAWNFDPANADMIIHSGDFTGIGSKYEVDDFFDWYSKLPIQYKVVVAGNHDKCFDAKFWEGNISVENYAKEAIKNFTALDAMHFYLQDSMAVIEGIKIYGSPWSKWFHGHNWAFNTELGTEEEFYSKLPDNIDILVTHGPPFGKLDYTNSCDYAGCEALLKRVKQIKPKYHLFGHIHEGYGETFDGDTTYLNSSIMNYHYEPVNKPQVFEI
ncbi:MAG: metallophosphatase domain-containing protein [Bacteroidia bacterium]